MSRARCTTFAVLVTLSTTGCGGAAAGLDGTAPSAQPAGVFSVHYEPLSGNCGPLADAVVLIDPSAGVYGCDCHVAATCQESSEYATGEQVAADQCARDAGGRSVESLSRAWAADGRSAEDILRPRSWTRRRVSSHARGPTWSPGARDRHEVAKSV